MAQNILYSTITVVSVHTYGGARVCCINLSSLALVLIMSENLKNANFLAFH